MAILMTISMTISFIILVTINTYPDDALIAKVSAIVKYGQGHHGCAEQGNNNIDMKRAVKSLPVEVQ